MYRTWLAPQGLHIEPAESVDAETLARLHARGFYRGWPHQDFAAYLADPERTPAWVSPHFSMVGDARRCRGS